ncbi:MAG: FAD-dependent oxidoreductase [Akkermansiaceae bacterium]
MSRTRVRCGSRFHGAKSNRCQIRPHDRRARRRRYPVSYRSIVPKKAECENLLVPVSLSASHVAFGSIRMEPVFMILGQSAGTAAALAIDGKQAIQDVPYAKLKELLVKQGQQL